MADKETCPLCGLDTCTLKQDDEFNYVIECNTYKAKAILSGSFYEDFLKRPEYNKALDLIVEKLIRQKKAPNGSNWFFYYSTNHDLDAIDSAAINLASILPSYPSGFIEKAERALMNLALLQPAYGSPLKLDYHDFRVFFEEPNGIRGMLFILEDLGYVRHQDHAWIISAEGWRSIEDLLKRHAEVKQGFVAMSFKPEAASIRKSFKEAITAAGYYPMIIDEKEHNHQIVPELLKEIEKSKFLVLDVTYPNYGAYYEAGYALALGKEVIICCDNKVFSDDRFERPHFDIAQTSQIRWSTEDELVERLIRRIKATVRE